ncbi:MAG TPA: GNAT family N-acetyltransferase [Pantanalinema sp.]
MSNTHDVTPSDNAEHSRFEVEVDGHLAVAEYRLVPEGIEFTHTVVPEQLEGRGIGSALARAGLDSARAKGLEVVPTCEFFQGYIKRHPAYHDLVHSSYRKQLGP